MDLDNCFCKIMFNLDKAFENSNHSGFLHFVSGNKFSKANSSS